MLFPSNFKNRGSYGTFEGSQVERSEERGGYKKGNRLSMTTVRTVHMHMVIQQTSFMAVQAMYVLNTQALLHT